MKAAQHTPWTALSIGGSGAAATPVYAVLDTRGVYVAVGLDQDTAELLATAPALAQALKETLEVFRGSCSAEGWKEWIGTSVHGPDVRNDKICNALAVLKAVGAV